ncbi:replication initiator [Actinomadura xylanilytica]|uniref:replication initiator n=1 Tax=Actinomadura xylanilytica TaxID=887459 RepID=UPI0032E3AC8F
MAQPPRRGDVLWHAAVPELWRRTMIYVYRALARIGSERSGVPVSVRAVRSLVRVSYVKVAEYQRRGAVHFHAVIRLDGVVDGDRSVVVAPPVWADVSALAAAIRDAAPITNTMYGQLWRRARAVALTGPERAAGLAQRPYDLRHGCASLLLNSGVPATEVARRLGHSLTVLMSTYAHWFTGMEQETNRLIDAALSGSEPSGAGSGADGLPTGQTPGNADA